jgi:hypothetical protein
MEASVPVRKKEYFEPGECPVPLYLWGIKRVPVPGEYVGNLFEFLFLGSSNQCQS